MLTRPRNALVTGVSTGIGYGTALALLQQGYKVFGSVRKPEDAAALLAVSNTQFVPLVFDVTDAAGIEAAVKTVESALGGEGLGCLVNNAGVAIGGPLQHMAWEDIRLQVEVNLLGVIAVTRAFLPLLGARQEHPAAPGRIVNISSVSGQIAFPFLASYVGTKHALEGLSHSLRRELLIYGIDVILIAPGAVKTPIWEKGIHPNAFDHTDYATYVNRFAKTAQAAGRHGFSPEYFGERIARIIDLPKPKVYYPIVPRYFRSYLIPRLLPARVLDGMIAKMFWKKKS